MARLARDVTKGGTGAAAHLGIDLAEYDARIRTFIPDYETMIEIAASALDMAVTRKTPTIVDLGIGTGALAEACLRRMPRARIVGMDEDAGMLAAARGRLGGSLARTIHASFEAGELPRCDAVVASLALHHIPTPARRLRLFRRLHRVLPSGGVIVSADCHPAGNSRLASVDRAVWLQHLEKSYAPLVARGYLRAWAREDHYAPLTDEVCTLQRAGFAVDICGRSYGFAVVVATKPARA
jgi:SAM-dependent methyltransferase